MTDETTLTADEQWAVKVGHQAWDQLPDPDQAKVLLATVERLDRELVAARRANYNALTVGWHSALDAVEGIPEWHSTDDLRSRYPRPQATLDDESLPVGVGGKHIGTIRGVFVPAATPPAEKVCRCVGPLPSERDEAWCLICGGRIEVQP